MECPSSPTKRRHWNLLEDKSLFQALALFPQQKWNEIAKTLGEQYGISGRSGKQCRERWHNHLNPELNSGPWGLEEQLSLFSTHQKLGNTWATITSLLPGRSENAVKNQFYSHMRRQFRKWKGSEPSRHQLKKHDTVLTAQIVAALSKKTKQKREKERGCQAPWAWIDLLEHIGPVDDICSEQSTWLTELDFSDPLEDDYLLTS